MRVRWRRWRKDRRRGSRRGIIEIFGHGRGEVEGKVSRSPAWMEGGSNETKSDEGWNEISRVPATTNFDDDNSGNTYLIV
jgi:hypothetical protein